MTKKILITSALPYVNNVPHLGNIIGCVLSADVYARFCRSMGYKTLYICATDEYGTATETKAREEQVSPKEICDKFHKIHAQVYKHFNIEFDFFGRTSHEEHTEITQSIFLDLEKQGMILEKESEQTFCEHDNIFLADRYVEGTCPHCFYTNARGDQCDSCGKLLQPIELLEPKCQICGNEPARKNTRHLYLDLPRLLPKIKAFHKKSMLEGKWSSNAISTTNGWIEKGLNPRPITRDLTWGVKVPRIDYENKVFYVWFDAPIGYISATKKAYPGQWKDWWFDNDNTKLYQFMAKDNIPFHTVVFPASLIGSGKPWTLLHHVNSTEYLNYENDKFSKSRNIGVFGTDVINTDIPVDLWRFYLLYNRPEKSDANFTWDSFYEDTNSNFIDNIGNLLNRIFVFYHKNFGDLIEPVPFDSDQLDFLTLIKEDEKQIITLLKQVQLKEALKTILLLGKKGNKFFQEMAPWVLIKQDRSKTQSGLKTLLLLLRDLGILLFPFMPDTSQQILLLFDDAAADYRDLGSWDRLEGKTLGKPRLLFQKLQKKKIDQYKQQFSGKKSQPSELPVDIWNKTILKVGVIKKVELHPSADRLFVEEIDLGEARNRTIVSGLVSHYKPEELLGKKVLVAANLTKATLRGIVSEGMLLAVEKKKELEVINAGDYPPGEQVLLEGEDSIDLIEGEITLDQFVSLDLRVENSEIKLGEKKLLLGKQPITTTQIPSGKVR